MLSTACKGILRDTYRSVESIPFFGGKAVRNTSQKITNEITNKLHTLLSIKGVLECFAAETSLANRRLVFFTIALCLFGKAEQALDY
jgi:hypothetical protein